MSEQWPDRLKRLAYTDPLVYQAYQFWSATGCSVADSLAELVEILHMEFTKLREADLKRTLLIAPTYKPMDGSVSDWERQANAAITRHFEQKAGEALAGLASGAGYMSAVDDPAAWKYEPPADVPAIVPVADTRQR